MSAVIGIDLGTTNTVVAVVRDTQASAIADEQGNVLIPSVVSFHPNGNVIVGRAAKDRRLIDPSNTIFSVKRLIGRSWDSEEVRRARSRFPFPMKEGPGQAALVVARGETYTLPEISAFVLRKAKSVAEAALGTTVERAVITVPANFNDLQRAATKVAGRVAGLEVMRILNEPTAAALAYGYGKSSSERIAVYDFGGGTFDVTLLDLSDNVFEVLATSGNTFLGGDDIDMMLAERMAEQFLAQHRYDVRTDPLAFEQLRIGAEGIKHQLSVEPEAHVKLDDIAHGPGGKPIEFLFSMTRTEFERMALPIVDRSFDVCREALSIARLSASDFEQVLLVGGSTRIPLVRRRVEEFFNRPIKANVSPDEVVAIGAAIQANALSGAERRAPVPPAPNPAAPGKRKSSTLPGVRPRMDTAPGVGGIPDTEPFAGRARMPTSPGLAGGAQRRPSQPAEPALGKLGGQLGRPIKKTDPGVGTRQKATTGTGLGPPPAQAQRAIPSPTLVSASDAALRAQQQAAAGTDIPLPLVGPDVSALDPSRIAAKYGNLPLTMPGATPPARTEDSVVALTDADVHDVDPSQVRPGLQSLSAPLSVSPETVGERDLLPALDEDDEPTHVGALKDALGGTALGGLTAPGHARLEAQPPSSAPSSFEPEVPAPPPWLAGDPEATPLVNPPLHAAAMGAAGRTQGLASPAAALPNPPLPPTERAPLSASTHALGTLGPMQIAQPEPAWLEAEGVPRPPVLVDVTPLTLSVETVDGFCDSIIERNATIPCERTRDFVTATDNQTTVRVRVSQGESSRFMENTLLGEVELSGLRPAPRGQVRISVTFALDAGGMMIVSAKEVATGRATTTRVRLVGLPDSHQLAHMMSRQAARQMM